VRVIFRRRRADGPDLDAFGEKGFA
jgi:hypothetical protein